MFSSLKGRLWSSACWAHKCTHHHHVVKRIELRFDIFISIQSIFSIYTIVSLGRSRFPHVRPHAVKHIMYAAERRSSWCVPCHAIIIVCSDLLYCLRILAYRIRSSCCYRLEVRNELIQENGAKCYSSNRFGRFFLLMLMYWPLSGRWNDNGAEVHNRAELRTITMIKISRVSQRWAGA